MRKLAPLFLTTSIIVFAGGNALAMGDFKKKSKAPEASTTSSTMSDSATNQAKPAGNSDSSTAGAMSPSVGSTATSGSPTVPANSQNPQGMSYSDRGSAAPGTNAKINSNDGTPSSGSSASASTTALANDDQRTLNTPAKTAAADAGTTTTTTKAKPKAKKKVVKNETNTQ